MGPYFDLFCDLFKIGPIFWRKKKAPAGTSMGPENLDSAVFGVQSGPLGPIRAYPDPTKAPVGPNGPHMGQGALRALRALK